jgi:GMP reductase
MSIGITQPELEKFVSVKKEVGENLKYICVDVANGYSERFVDFISTLRDNYSDVVIIAGNVVTADQTQELLLNGADIIKVGIGPGSVCTTRIKTGVGYPQLSAVIECADAAHGLNGHIIADGGCVFPGDVVKAFAGGADFVMIGGMLAGHTEGGGEVVTKYYTDGEYHLNEDVNSYTPVIKPKEFVEFYGMSSKTANEKHFGGLKDYRSSEGRTALVPYRGEVKETVQDILGGVRSACTYVGARKLKQLSKCTTFVTTARQYNTRYEESTIGD